MRRAERGSAEVVLALVIAAGLALTGLVLAWNHYTTKLDVQGYDRGVQETTAKVVMRDNAALVQAAAQIKALVEKARADEAVHAKALATIGGQLEIANGKLAAEKARIATDISAGRLVRRDAAFSGGCTQGHDPGAAGAAVAAPGRSNGEKACQLSEATEGRVLAIGADADAVAGQLAAAQDVITEYFRLCGPTPKGE